MIASQICDWPKISLITPSFNQGKYLEDTLQSVFIQKYPNLEYIVIDGGSTDETIDVLKRYEDSLAYWVSEPDKGQTDALIKGFSKATGDIFCWLCSDDLLEPWTLREVGEYFIANTDVNCVYGDTTWIDPSGGIIRRRKELPFSPFIFLYEHNFVPQPSTFWRSDIYKEVGGLDDQFDVAMDADLWIRFSAVTPLHHLRRPWSRMRLYPEQKTQRLKERASVEGKILRERYYGSEPMMSYRLKKGLAKSIRFAWKLAAGCYW